MNLLFLCLFGFALIADIIFFSYEKYLYSLIIMFGSLGAAYYFMPTFAQFIHLNWSLILTHYVPIYLIIGIVTAGLKWIVHNVKHVRWITEVKKQFDIIPREECVDPSAGFIQKEVSEAEKKAHSDSLNSAARRKAFVKYFKDGHFPGRRMYPVYSDQNWTDPDSVIKALTPRAKDNIDLITIWIFQWPIVILSTVISDFFVELGRQIAHFFDFVFTAPVRAMVARATKGL